ncbi:MAG: phosphodiesterase [Planctomycetaceae bacterium]|nr:phosphodiesterase [Planctomycetaceae bacterium]
MPRIVQLTDLHLLCDQTARLKNVPTWETFRDVCRHVRANAGEWDLMVLTGDLAHDELAETYALLREELGDWLPRCRLVPGNHDNRFGLRTVFSEIVPANEGFLSFSEEVAGWRILGVDSHWPAEIPGRIEREQLDWFTDQLENHRDQPTLVFLHHPPISVNSPWLDKIGLENPEAFQQLITDHPQIQAVITGHVHHVFQGKLGTADVLTSPSTAIQFEPQGEDSSYTHDLPGYRIFDLDGESYQTEVLRLDELRFPPVKE